MNVKYVCPISQVPGLSITWLTSELTISSGTLCTIETVAVEMGVCWFPFVLCSLRGRGKKCELCFLRFVHLSGPWTHCEWLESSFHEHEYVGLRSSYWFDLNKHNEQRKYFGQLLVIPFPVSKGFDWGLAFFVYQCINHVIKWNAKLFNAVTSSSASPHFSLTIQFPLQYI